MKGGGHALGFLAALAAMALLSGCARRAEVADGGDPLAAGWEAYRLGEFGVAARAFEAARARYAPDDPRRAMASYALATTWNLRTPVGDQDKPRAEALYREAIAAAPDGDMAAWSLLALARMRHVAPVGSAPDYAAVREAYQRVIERFPDHLAGHEAFIYQQSTFIQTLQPEPTREAMDALRGFVAAHPRSGFRSAAYALIAAGAETLRDPAAQLEAELRSLEHMETDPSNPKFENSGTYWRIAAIAEFEAGDFETARRFYRRLLEEYPRDIRVFACEEALARMDATEAGLRRAGRQGGAP